MRRLKTVVAGGGLISQVEHIPNLLFLKSKFELAGVADPSASARRHIARQFGIAVFQTLGELWDLEPDAIIIGAPDAYHHEFTAAALDRGIHVLCEKPLAVSIEAIDDLIQRRDSAGRVLQVGLMKRWDPSYELLHHKVAGRGKELRYIAVEVYDPDSWPFVDHHALLRANDVPKRMREEGRSKLHAQAAIGVGCALDDDDLYAYVDSFSSSMIHDLNIVLGLFVSMGIDKGTASSANIFAKGRGTSATMMLNDGQALCQLAHVVVPRLADYQERISLFFDNCRFELIFPSPYLHNYPTRLLEFTSNGHHLQKTEHRASFHEAFVRELEGFWSSATEGTPVRNTPEEALLDMQLIRDFMRLALAARQQFEHSP